MGVVCLWLAVLCACDDNKLLLSAGCGMHVVDCARIELLLFNRSCSKACRLLLNEALPVKSGHCSVLLLIGKLIAVCLGVDMGICKLCDEVINSLST